jgi:hypothetical protein
MFVELRTPIPVDADGKEPALAIGSMVEADKLHFVVVAKSDGAIAVEPITWLKGAGLYVTRE